MRRPAKLLATSLSSLSASLSSTLPTAGGNKSHQLFLQLYANVIIFKFFQTYCLGGNQ